ncbi:MAG: DUF5615 family PIN-like protein [Xenococcaceae cyanobacterium]
MSLKLFVDEDSQAKLLVILLKHAGHNVLTVNEAGLVGLDDEIIFENAKKEERLVLTRNYDDFQTLHQANPNHPGILVIYSDADVSKDMSFKAIVKAIANLEAANIPLANQFISLNQWNY